VIQPYFDVDMMDTKQYFDFFKLFGIKNGQSRGGTLPGALGTGQTLEYEILFSRNYAAHGRSESCSGQCRNQYNV